MKKTILPAIMLLITAMPLHAQKLDKDHTFLTGRNYFGLILNHDADVRDILATRSFMTGDMAFGFSTIPSDNSEFAASYGYPSFGLGVSVSMFSDLILKGDSHLADIYTIYGFFERQLVRGRKFSLGYTVEAGISTAVDPYDPISNPYNYFVSSPVMVYIAAGAGVKWRPRTHWEFGAEVTVRHYSNGRLGLPNKGLNIIGGGISARYFLEAAPKSYPKRRGTSYGDRGLYYHIMVGGGVHSSYPEWELYNLMQENPQDKQINFRKYPKLSLSGDVMYRYSRKYGTGIGIDLFYSTNTKSLKECDEMLYNVSGSGHTVKYDPFSVGISVVHEIYYKNVALFVAFGYYPYREMGISDNISRFYQKGGFRLYLPKWSDMFVGIAVKAHKLSIAEYLEVSIGMKM